jgi:hypothetical protein
MNVNQSSVMRVLRAALFGFVLFLVGYMIPHPGALATPAPKATGDSVPGGFKGKGLVTINQGAWPCATAATCSFYLSVQATASPYPSVPVAGSPTPPACSNPSNCGSFGSGEPFTITWTDTSGGTLTGYPDLYVYGTLSASPQPSP